MVKNENLSNDLDFIKEFEELKLKQKLLIESLNRKNKTEMNQFLLDINSKLDFLVKIFKESQEAEEEDTTQDEIKSDLKSLLEKINSLETKIDDNFEEQNSKINSINNLLSKTEGIVERNLENKNLPELNFKVGDNNQTQESNGIKKVDSKKEEKEVEKKKKKWF